MASSMQADVEGNMSRARRVLRHQWKHAAEGASAKLNAKRQPLSKQHKEILNEKSSDHKSATPRLMHCIDFFFLKAPMQRGKTLIWNMSYTCP